MLTFNNVKFNFQRVMGYVSQKSFQWKIMDIFWNNATQFWVRAKHFYEAEETPETPTWT